MKNIRDLIPFLILIGFTSFAQTPSLQNTPPLAEAPPKSAGMSQERLDLISDMLQEAISDGKIPGAVALVARDGKVVYHKAFGMADVQADRDLERTDIFRIASQTKAITSTAVMMLWEKGHFRLDDPVSQFIPEFEAPRILDTFNEADTTYTSIPAENPITIRHLLTHTSGIGYGFIDADPRMKMIYHKAGIIDAFTTRDVTIEENIKKLASLPLHHEPGSDWTYGEGLDVLGYFVEVVSGKPFDLFLREHIFDPLTMDDTYFYLPGEKAKRLVTVQHLVEGEWQPFPVTSYDPEYPLKGAKAFFSGGAGLSSTTLDYAKFLQMYLNGGEYNGTRFLSRTTVDLILSNQIGNLWEGQDRDFGLAFALLNEKGEITGGKGSDGTFEWGGYFNTHYFADPDEQILGILFKQTQGDLQSQTGWKFKQLVFQAIDD